MVNPFDSVALNNAQLNLVDSCRAKAKELLAEFQTIPPSRESSLAITNLEQSLMWANKAISRMEQPKDG